MVFQAKAKLIKNIEVKPKYYKILLSCLPIAKEAKPGQFVSIKIGEDYEPLLRRPFSINGVKERTIEILYEIVGKATTLLSYKQAGDYLDIIGPLGRGFDYKSIDSQPTKLPILVAGGMGVAPLLFLAERLLTEFSKSTRRPLVLIGARTKKQILCEEEFKKLGYDVRIATDDGSRGFKGYVSGLLESLVSTVKPRLSTIYACGPRPMLKEITLISKKYRIPAQISLEEHMACGFGACLGCVVNTKDGYRRVCRDGPVFNAQDILWQEGG